MHGAQNFPFKKENSDLDIPLATGTGDDLFLNELSAALTFVFTKHTPDFVFYLAGVDVLASDKLGKLALTKAGCKARDRLVFETCLRYQVPVQVSMGGGYSESIRTIVDAHCNTFRAAIDLFSF
jgi:acetoin utilization deacetylase AcuC-like enzyme